MRKLLNMLKKDDNTLSVGRLCAVCSFVLFAFVSLYLALLGKSWQGYETFAWVCASYVLVQLGNKAVEIGIVRVRKDAQL